MYSTESNMKRKGLQRKKLITKNPNYTTFYKQPEAIQGGQTANDSSC